MSIDRACISYVEIGTGRTQGWASAARVGRIIRWLAVGMAAASLAACAQSSVVSQKSELRASRVTSLNHDRACPLRSSGASRP
jgi:rare lipoprotein A